MTHSLPIVTPVWPETGAADLDMALEGADGRGIADLTQRLAAVEEEAFCDFHRRYFDRLFRMAVVLTRGDPVAAGDVLQETLCRVARCVRRFDDQEVFWCWLAAVAVAQAEPFLVEKTTVRFISDDELLGMFPGRPVGLIGAPGRQRFVFLDQNP